MGCLSAEKASYIGRFAPSPTGALHFGSLVAALASYLDAKANNGLWLVRMEDLDPAREPPEAAAQILQTLENFHLFWDGPVLYQSQRLTVYRAVLEELIRQNLIYPCSCSRQTIKAMGGVYDGRCRVHPPGSRRKCAHRLHVAEQEIHFNDLVQGLQQQDLARETGDFVVLRKDGLFAYQLAVVVDDGYQNITHIVRGTDLLDSTARQIYLQQLLNLPQPQYAHIPVASNAQGQKLSKQHFAEPVASEMAAKTLHQALRFLGQNPPMELATAPVQEQLPLAIQHWDIQAVPKLANIRV